MTVADKLLEMSTLSSGHTALEHFTHISTGSLSGAITLNNNAYMEIAIPVKGKKVKEYFLDWIADETGHPIEDSVEFVKTFPANDNSTGRYLVFVPGVTKPENEGNFYLVGNDGDSEEINGFLCKMKDYKAFYDGDLVFTWNSADGE